jgi:hypothetical protein
MRFKGMGLWYKMDNNCPVNILNIIFVHPFKILPENEMFANYER